MAGSVAACTYQSIQLSYTLIGSHKYGNLARVVVVTQDALYCCLLIGLSWELQLLLYHFSWPRYFRQVKLEPLQHKPARNGFDSRIKQDLI